MPRFKIFTHVRACRNGIKFYYYAVHIFNKAIDNWVFVKSFLTLEHAEDFIRDLVKDFRKGDSTWLTLK